MPKIASSTTAIATKTAETGPHETESNCNVISIRELRLVSVIVSPGMAERSAVRGADILKTNSAGEKP